MMRSRRHQSMSPGQWLALNPFLAVAIIAGVALAAHTWNIGSEQITGWLWNVLGYGFHVVGNLLNSILPDLEGWIYIALTAVLGLVLYLLLDALWRRLRPS